MSLWDAGRLAFSLLSPFPLAMLLILGASTGWTLRRPRWGAGLALAAFALLWVASMPVVAQALLRTLAGDHRPVPAQAAPQADAILVLGGSLAGASPPYRPSFILGPAAQRVWYAAELYRAGKARWVVVAAGNQPDMEEDQPEAEAIAQMLVELRVPPSAIRLEGRSTNTRENAEFSLAIVQSLGARRVLLVTSAEHMRRALSTFSLQWRDSGIEVIPAVTGEAIAAKPRMTVNMWLPSLGALLSVTKSLKELAGIVGLLIIEVTCRYEFR